MDLLNPPQRAAVRYLDGPCLVLAGAGSGKTRVIAHKIRYLIENTGLAAKHIAAVTFTNKAADEMMQRVRTLLPTNKLRGLSISTFHRLGLNILREESQAIGYRPQFTILDGSDTSKIIEQHVGHCDKTALRDYAVRLSRLKNKGRSPDEAIAYAQNKDDANLAALYRQYQDTLFAYQAVDLDDLIYLPVALLQKNEALRQKWQGRVRYILIDEYQDSNAGQYALLTLLAGASGRFTVVGDNDQSIYAWRGADSDNLRLLKDDYPDLNVIPLEQNYRSTARILRCANAVISHNAQSFKKSLWSDLGIGDLVHIIESNDETHEAERLAIKLAAHRFHQGTAFKDYAVLYRSRHQAKVIETQFRAANIPYHVHGGQSFFDKTEVKDVLAYLRLLANDHDDPAFIRAVTTPPCGVGNASLTRLGAYARQRQISLLNAVFEEGLIAQMPEAPYQALHDFALRIGRYQARVDRENPGLLLQELVLEIDYPLWLDEHDSPQTAKQKKQNIDELCAWIQKQSEEKPLPAILQTLMLLTLLDGRDPNENNAVHLSTLHAAKGLEYPHVFLIGCEEDILPHRNAIDTGCIEEERRLMYVGITRAQRSLTISYCSKRRKGKAWQTVEPSRFLSELPQDDVKLSTRAASQKTTPVVSKQEGSAVLAGLIARLKSA